MQKKKKDYSLLFQELIDRIELSMKKIRSFQAWASLSAAERKPFFTDIFVVESNEDAFIEKSKLLNYMFQLKMLFKEAKKTPEGNAFLKKNALFQSLLENIENRVSYVFCY